MARLITLAAPALIDNQLRQPADGAFIVSDEDAARLAGDGLLAGEPEEVVVVEEVAALIAPPADSVPPATAGKSRAR